MVFVQSNLADAVNAAALVLMVLLCVVARIVVAPSANTINWLSATLVGALLLVVGVWAGLSIVGRSHGNVVQPASLVLVSLVVMSTRVVLSPRANTVNRLGTASLGALLVLVNVWAGVATMLRWSHHHICAATFV